MCIRDRFCPFTAPTVETQRILGTAGKMAQRDVAALGEMGEQQSGDLWDIVSVAGDLR